MEHFIGQGKHSVEHLTVYLFIVYSVVGLGTTVEITLPCILNDWNVKNLEALQ